MEVASRVPFTAAPSTAWSNTGSGNGGEFLEVNSLFVDSIDEAFLFQFYHDAIINDFIDPEGRAGFARQRLLDLNLHSFLRCKRYPLKQFGVGLIARFEITFVVLARVFGKDSFAFLFSSFEKVRPIDQGHHDPFDRSAVARQIALRGCDADIGKWKAVRQVSHADENAVGHAFGELDRPGR